MDLAERVVDGSGEWKEAADLVWSDRGRLAAMETPSGLYFGFIHSIIFHFNGEVYIAFERDGSESKATVPPGTRLFLSREERQPDRPERYDRR